MVLGLVVAAIAGLVPVGGARALPGLPPVGPDVPAATAPVASVTVFDDEVWSFEEGAHTHSFSPPAAYNRVVLELSGRPDGDPWDRLFGVSIDGAEVLRGTTPRAAFTITKDVTAYSRDWAAGTEMAIHAGTWVGALRFSAVLRFYDDPTAALVAGPAAQVVAPVRWSYLGGTGSSAGSTAAFAATAPSQARLELYTSGHSQTGEFWYLSGPAGLPQFRILVDGQSVGEVTALPYVYALLGFNGAVGQQLHPLLWWVLPQILDVVGVHGGIGEIPPYVVDVDPAHLPLLTGARAVTVEQTSGQAVWVTSLTVLAD